VPLKYGRVEIKSLMKSLTKECRMCIHNITIVAHLLEFGLLYLSKVKLKLSHYTSWRRTEGEEV
jgi:hypothetical protein